jgi:mannose-1-phosphate guanylyltransferase
VPSFKPFATGGSSGVAALPQELTAPAAASPADAPLWAVILAGGIGSRFWPLSSPQRPKQLLALVSERPLLTETVSRLAPLIPPERVLVMTSRDIAASIRAAIPEVPDANVIIEPRPLGTAAALAWAASEVTVRGGGDSVFCCLHADLAVAFDDAFRHVLREASRVAATDDALVTVGVRPTRGETGFGYILPSLPLRSDQPLEAGGACAVSLFEEKPARPRAEHLIAEGALWNAGIFVWRARVVLSELEEHAVELSGGLSALEARDHAAFVDRVQPVSLERGLLERSRRVVVVPGEFGWDDVGTWAALRRARDLDDTGNGASGRAHFLDASGNVVHVEGSSVVLYGVNGMLVVTLPGITFVTTLDRAADLRPLLDSLPPDLRMPGPSGAPNE